MAPRTQGMFQRGARGKGRGMEIDVLVDLDRALASVARDHQTKAVRALGFGERPLLIRRGQAFFFGKNPDLQKVDELRWRVVELAVSDARPSAHPLNVPGADDGARPETVFVRERSLEDIGDDLHVSMRVSAEALARLNAILVDHAKRAKAHEARLVVIGEGKRVVALEPTVLGVSPLLGSAHSNHDAILSDRLKYLMLRG